MSNQGPSTYQPYCWAKLAHKFHTHHTVSYISICTQTDTPHSSTHTLHHTVTQTLTPQRVRNDNRLKNHVIISFVKLHPSYIPPNSTPSHPPPHPLHQACRKAQPKACQKGPFSRSARTKGSVMPWAHWPLKPVDVLIVSSHLVLDGFVTTEAVLDVGDDSEVMLNFGRAAKLNRKRQLCSSARSPFEICSFLSCKSALWSICVCWV